MHPSPCRRRRVNGRCLPGAWRVRRKLCIWTKNFGKVLGERRAGNAQATLLECARRRCLDDGPVPMATRTHRQWNMDLVHEALLDGLPFQMLTVTD